jgi:hypothetical protein
MNAKDEATTEGSAEIYARIPIELEPYRPAIGAALFYLAVGAKEPAPAPAQGDTTKVRIKVSPTAKGYLDALTVRFGSQNQTVIAALAWVAAQEPARRALLENTII